MHQSKSNTYIWFLTFFIKLKSPSSDALWVANEPHSVSLAQSSVTDKSARRWAQWKYEDVFLANVQDFKIIALAEAILSKGVKMIHMMVMPIFTHLADFTGPHAARTVELLPHMSDTWMLSSHKGKIKSS